MKDSLTSVNHQDFRQRYNGTYGWLRQGEDKRLLVYVAGVDHRQVSFQDANGTIYYAKVDTGVEFEFIPVNRGWFNTVDKQVVFLQRLPRRQWRRGICSDNTQFSDISNPEYAHSLTFPRIINIFKDGFDNWQVDDYMKPPYAVSKQFAIGKAGTVWFYNQKIGSLAKDEIFLKDTFVKQELTDILRRKKANIKVANV